MLIIVICLGISVKVRNEIKKQFYETWSIFSLKFIFCSHLKIIVYLVWFGFPVCLFVCLFVWGFTPDFNTLCHISAVGPPNWLVTIRLNVRDQLTRRNNALPEDRTSNPRITYPMLSLLSLSDWRFWIMQIFQISVILVNNNNYCYNSWYHMTVTHSEYYKIESKGK